MSKYYKGIPDPRPDLASLAETTKALKENVEVLTRQRQPIAAGAVTWADLVELGLITSDRVPIR